MDTKQLQRVTKDLSDKFDILHKVRKVSSHLEKMNNRIRAAELQRKQLAARIAKDEKDLEKMEKTSIKSLFYNVLGSKEDQIERQRQEYLEDSLKYNELVKTLEMLHFEKSVLEKRMNQIGHIESEIDNLIKEKEKLLLKVGGESGNQILAIIKEQRRKNAMFKEINEAIIAGSKAKNTLAKMINHLNAAINWGRWDMSGQAKYYATNNKHSRIDKARHLANQAKHQLMKFQDELKDVFGYEDYHLSFKMENFSQFTDVFFDNLISDWIIQQKIKNTLNSVAATYDKVSRLINSVKNEEGELEQKIIELEKRKRSLIIES